MDYVRESFNCLVFGFFTPPSTFLEGKRCHVFTLVRIFVFVRARLESTSERPAGRWEEVHLPDSTPQRRRQLPRDTVTRAERREPGRGAQEHGHAAPRDNSTAEGKHFQTARHHQRADHQAVALRLGHRRQEV